MLGPGGLGNQSSQNFKRIALQKYTYVDMGYPPNMVSEFNIMRTPANGGDPY